MVAKQRDRSRVATIATLQKQRGQIYIVRLTIRYRIALSDPDFSTKAAGKSLPEGNFLLVIQDGT